MLSTLSGFFRFSTVIPTAIAGYTAYQFPEHKNSAFVALTCTFAPVIISKICKYVDDYQIPSKLKNAVSTTSNVANIVLYWQASTYFYKFGDLMGGRTGFASNLIGTVNDWYCFSLRSGIMVGIFGSVFIHISRPLVNIFINKIRDLCDWTIVVATLNRIGREIDAGRVINVTHNGFQIPNETIGPLTEKQLETLCPLRSPGHGNAISISDKCAICCEDFTEKSMVRALPCHEKHIFHPHCIDNWLLNRKAECPLCKKRIEVEVEHDQTEHLD